MVEKSYGSWDQMSGDYDAGYTAEGAADGVYFDPKTQKYYGIIRSRLSQGRGGNPFGGRKYKMQRDVYTLEESELDQFRAFFKKYDGGKMKGDYAKASKQFKRYAMTDTPTRQQGKQNPLAGQPGGSMSDPSNMMGAMTTGSIAGKYANEMAEDEFLAAFEGQAEDYRQETTAGGRGQRRKAALQRREAAQDRYKQGLMSTGWGGGS